MENTKREQLQKIVFTIFSFYLINENIFEKYSVVLANFSIVNLIIVFCFCLSILNIPNVIDEKIDIKVLIATISFVTLVITGIVSNIVYNNQPVSVWSLDIFLFSRFIFIYIFFMIFMDKKNINEYQLILTNIFKIIMTVNFILLILNVLFHFLPIFDIRYGLSSQRLLYTHPTYLGSISFFGWYLLKSSKQDVIYQAMSIVLILSTLRTKLIFLMLLFYIVKFLLRNSQMIGIKNLSFLIISNSLLVVLFKNQIDTKLLENESSMRNILMTKAKIVASEYFPIGSGFGTFGSFTSFKYYSPLYERLGMSNLYGFTKNFYIYGMDSYYSLLIAQFGYLGLVLFIVMLFFISLLYFDLQKFELKKYVFLIYIVVSCFTESTLTSSVGVLFFIILALESKQNKKSSEIVNK